MSLITLSGVAVAFGATTILEDVGLTVSRGDRWGIVGRNGSGKTSLLNVVTGAIDPARGTVTRASGLRFTLLDQHRTFPPGTTLWSAAAAPFAPLIALERSLEEHAAALGSAPSTEALDRYDRDLDRFARLGGYGYAARVDAVLDGLAFDPEAARTRTVDQLSGGELGRLGLASQLVAPADILLLDEPTNHLDLETTRWLEAYLRGLDATVLLISHDRVFLDAVVDHVLHLQDGTATAYDAGYTAFLAQHAERRLVQERAFNTQRRVIEKEEDYIRRNIAGQNSRQAKGRRTRLARLPRLSPPPGEDRVMGLRLEAKERGGDQVLVTRDVRLEVPGRVLLEAFTARIERGEVVAMVGPNGAGKSTLLRAIAGARPVDGGELRPGASTQLAYYRQDLTQVPEGKSLFDVIHDLRPLWNRGQVQAHLGRFGFPGETALRLADRLSGGERARLALAMLVLDRANFLLFDEPTNHLDVESIEALEDAIDDFDGTVLLVSHDRALLRTLATRVWILDDARITDFPGTFAEWEETAERKRQEEARVAAEEAAARRERDRLTAKRRDTATARDRTSRRALRSAVEDAEAEVERLEALAEDLRSRLEDTALYETGDGARRAGTLKVELEAIEADIAEAIEAWESASEALETDIS